MATRFPCGRESCLLDRRPERLLVMGYRHWLAGYETGSIAPWEMAWTLFANDLGPPMGRIALSAVADWVRALRNTTEESPKYYPHSYRWLCRDECFALSAVSALQHGDGDCALASLCALIDAERLPNATSAAKSVADEFFRAGQVLLPVPRAVVDDIASRPPRENYH